MDGWDRKWENARERLDLSPKKESEAVAFSRRQHPFSIREAIF